MSFFNALYKCEFIELSNVSHNHGGSDALGEACTGAWQKLVEHFAPRIEEEEEEETGSTSTGSFQLD
jgi:hypothetical protein